MKFTFAFTTLVTTALAASSCAAPPTASSTPTPTPDPYGYFGVISARSASPIHLLSLTARGGKFYLGGPGPSSYCPVEQVGDACPAGNSTVLVGGDGGLSLGVIVPGGQLVYVAPDGSLSYTGAHSGYIPAGSITDQFSRDAPVEGQQFGYLHFETGFVACPAGEGEGYKVFGQVQNGTYSAECLGFSALTVTTDEPGAWQY